MKAIRRKEPLLDRLFGDSDWWWTLRRRFVVAYWVARRRPLLKCPHCKGKGGSCDYWGEWDECSTCFEHWQEVEDGDHTWFTGRMPPMAWVRCKIADRVGYDPRTSLTDMMACYSGCHVWVAEYYYPGKCGDESNRRHDGDWCVHCYAHRRPDWSIPRDEFSRGGF